jgi:hypothetical protein
MKLKQTSILILGISLAAGSARVSANNDFKFNGYLNVLGSVSDSETEYLEDISKDSTFAATNFGIVASKQINKKLRVAAQLHGEHDSYSFDWGYASYNFSSSLTGKAGKIKYPGNLVSETVDIGVTYPWAQAPVAIYGGDAGLSFEAYTGTSLVYTAGDDVEFATELYLGEADSEAVKNKRLIGVVFSATTDNIRAQASINSSVMEFESFNDPTPPPEVILLQDKTMTNISAGIKAEYDLATVYAEYAQTSTSGLPQMDRTGWYVTVLHDFEKWSPHLTYQSYEGMLGIEETIISVGINRKLDLSTVVKLDLQQVEPINGGFFESQPVEDKVNVVNISLSMVF